MEDKTSVGIERSTKDRLDSHGKKGETYDELLNRLMDDAEHLGKVRGRIQNVIADHKPAEVTAQ